jgi:hypothetical protein
MTDPRTLADRLDREADLIDSAGQRHRPHADDLRAAAILLRDLVDENDRTILGRILSDLELARTILARLVTDGTVTVAGYTGDRFLVFHYSTLDLTDAEAAYLDDIK